MRLIFFLFFIPVFIHSAFSQSVESFKSSHWGITGGVNYSTTTPQGKITELIDIRRIEHQLNNPQFGIGQNYTLFYQKKVRHNLSLQAEVSLIKVKTKYNYFVQEFRNKFGLIVGRTQGIFHQKRTSLRFPLIAMWTFGKGTFKPSIQTGVFVNGAGVGSGSWQFKERQFASIQNDSISIYDPPRILSKQETFRLPGKTHIGWIFGGNLAVDVTKIFDLLIDARFEQAFNSENKLIPYKRFGYSLAIGLRFSIENK